jgi:TetR/AcrR family transcriptional repressor of nem operon
VARYDAAHKQATRQRILHTAAQRLKQDGIDGSGVATLMADAGLTNGAFYAHFASKTDLVANVVAAQLEAQAERLAALPEGRPGLETAVRAYLSAEHRDTPGDGCPSAALLDEISRSDPAVREAYSTGLQSVVDALARRVDPADPASAAPTVMTAFALLIGALQLARAVTDPALSDRILTDGIDTALQLLTR